MTAVESIKNGLNQNKPYKILARMIFLSYPTFAFLEKEDVEFDIKNEISEYFRIPITSIQVSGSSKTGYSPYKKREFIMGASDLDVAIVSNLLFTKYTEITHKITKGYSDLSKFPIDKRTGENKIDYFLSSLNNGFFRPDLMPGSKIKIDWFNFFNELSNKYFQLFKSINAGIYASEYYFESKQIDCIEKFKNII